MPGGKAVVMGEKQAGGGGRVGSGRIAKNSNPLPFPCLPESRIRAIAWTTPFPFKGRAGSCHAGISPISLLSTFQPRPRRIAAVDRVFKRIFIC